MAFLGSAGTSCLLSAVVYLGGTALHLLTVLIAFTQGGFFAALVTLCTPVFSEAYWAFASASKAGWGTPYHFYLLAYVSALVLFIAFGALSAKIAPQE